MIIISACLAGEKCRYDGKSCPNEKVVEFISRHKVILICPECLGGLPNLRSPSEIKGDKVISKEGFDRTEEFRKGALKALEIAQKNECRLAILKSKSPSCGIGKIYDGSFSGTLTCGNGITAQMFLDHGIEVIDENMFRSFQIPEE